MSDTNHTRAARPCTVILRGLEGEFTEEVLVFGAGFSVGPFSLGKQGDWRVRANGVANVHVYLWFDGLTVRAARLLGGPEAWLDGEPLREDWSPLLDGSELRVGAAKVLVATQAQPHPPAEPSKRAPSCLERLGLSLTRRGAITWRVLLLACGVPAVVLVWLAMTSSGQPRHKTVPTPSTHRSAAKVGSLTAPAPTSATSVSSSWSSSGQPRRKGASQNEAATDRVSPAVIVTTGRVVARRVVPLGRTTYHTPNATKLPMPTASETFESR